MSNANTSKIAKPSKNAGFLQNLLSEAMDKVNQSRELVSQADDARLHKDAMKSTFTYLYEQAMIKSGLLEVNREGAGPMVRLDSQNGAEIITKGFESIRAYLSVKQNSAMAQETWARYIRLFGGRDTEDFVTNGTGDRSVIYMVRGKESVVAFVEELVENRWVWDGKHLTHFNSFNVVDVTVELSGFDYNLSNIALKFQVVPSDATNLTAMNQLWDIVANHVTTDPVDQATLTTIIGINQQGFEYSHDSLESPIMASQSFYPWMKHADGSEYDLVEYIRDFMASKSKILVLFGDPGTGKSTLLRTAIKKLGMKALATSNQTVLSSDVFVKYCGAAMTGKGADDDEGGGRGGYGRSPAKAVRKYDVLIAEDADVLIATRKVRRDEENGILIPGNKVMSDLLEAMDGIGTEHSFKLIVTTNLRDLRGVVDGALLRPGRCFDQHMFGPLTAKQAAIARFDAGKPPKEFKDGEYITLAAALADDDVKFEVFEGDMTVKPRFGFRATMKDTK